MPSFEAVEAQLSCDPRDLVLGLTVPVLGLGVFMIEVVQRRVGGW